MKPAPPQKHVHSHKCEHHVCKHTRKAGSVMLELSNVVKDYPLGESIVHALRGANLDVLEGEFVAIMGKSGSGKSTLLHILGLLDIPSSGTMSMDHTDVTTLTEDQRAEFRGKKIGFVFQFFHLIPSLSAWENVALPLIFQGVGEGERRGRAYAALKKVDLADRMDHLPNQMSGGERQRVAIARALVTNPPILLCDEPTGNLDSKTGHEIIDMLCQLNEKEGKTIIFVTHDKDIAEHCKRIVYIKDGVIEKSEVLR